MTQQPFSGIKVADFTWWMAGPLATKTLADYGATVVRVESAKRPGGLRITLPYKDNVPGVDRSGFYTFYNANKYSISLDLGTPEGREIARKLISWADIAAENFNPGVMEKWGLGYEDLKNQAGYYYAAQFESRADGAIQSPRRAGPSIECPGWFCSF